MAMLHVVASLSKRFGLELHAHGVDHGLRYEAQAELDGADNLARALGIPFTRSNISVLHGANLQARARDQRYEELRRVARTLSASFIATAHHADDRAETVLIRLMRGAGPAGLAVLPPRTHELLRPLIRARKCDIHAHLSRHSIRYAEDPSNSDLRYLRTRVRNHLLPSLLRESPTIVEHLNALADRMLELTAGGSTPLGLTRSQADDLRRLVREPREGFEIALRGGWVLRLERRKIRAFSIPAPQ